MRMVIAAVFLALALPCAASAAPAGVREAVAAAEARTTNLHGVVVERGGEIIAERYAPGSDREVGELLATERRFDANTLHGMRSISKSVVGLLVGIAVAEGSIPSLDTSVLDLLPERGRGAAPGTRRITVRHLLTMSAGLRWSEGGLLSDETRMEFAGDKVGYVLGRPMAAAPGAKYLYNSGCTILLGAILERSTGMPLEDYARSKLFAPLGIEPFEWRRDSRGDILAHAGLRMTPRDLARIGRLMLDGGRSGARQIVPADYVRESIAGLLPAEQDWRYGFQWRSGVLATRAGPRSWAAAFGNGGQRLYVVPEEDLVVVVTAGRYNAPYPVSGRPSEQLFRQIVEAAVAR